VWAVLRLGGRALLYFGGNAEDVAGNRGVAVQLAAARPVERLVLVTAYDSLLNVARQYFWWLPVGLLLRDRYESARRAPEASALVLVVIAAKDEIIPRARSDALAAAFAPRQAGVVVVPGVGHNTLDLSPRYLRSIAAFLAGPRAAPGVLEAGTG